MKKIIILAIIIKLFLSYQLKAVEVGQWTFVVEDDYCYIGSLPATTDLPEGKKRGDTYILVYRMLGNKDSIIQIEAGYNYKLNKFIEVKIDNAKYKFYTTEDVSNSAWTDDDPKVIVAMKKGLKLVVIGESSRGTVTNDTYTLEGFTAAFKKLSEDC